MVIAAGCRTEEKVVTEQQPDESPAPAQKVDQEEAPGTQETQKAKTRTALQAPGVGSCVPSSELQSTVQRMLDHADADGDGAVSKQEAKGLVNFMLGGIFFRADENDDGKITPEEAREVRQEFADQYPQVTALFSYARDAQQATETAPFKRIAEIMDVEYGEPVTSAEVREAAGSALEDLYRLVDENEDGTITLSEARAASLVGGAALGAQAFEAADRDGDGAVQLAELETALTSVLKPAFGAADADSDGKLTKSEALKVMERLGTRLGMVQPEQVQPKEPGEKNL